MSGGGDDQHDDGEQLLGTVVHCYRAGGDEVVVVVAFGYDVVAIGYDDISKFDIHVTGDNDRGQHCRFEQRRLLGSRHWQ